VNAVPTIDFDPSQSTDALVEEIERWISSEPVAELVDAFGGAGIEAADELATRLEKLAVFSERWDFRRGEERNLAKTMEFAESHTALIDSAAHALGLVDSRPPRFDRYDHMVVLGGLIRACVLRPRLAASILSNGVEIGTATGIGAFRPLGGDEPALAEAAGLTAIGTEFDAMVAGMCQAFGLGEPRSERGEDAADNPNLSWRVREYETERGMTVSVVAAPTTDPARRANTPDSYQYLAEQLIHVNRGERVLAITSAIYIPFQHADAIRMLGLGYGVHVDTVGVDTTVVREQELRQTFTPSQYLQEVRSAFLSMRNLHGAVAT
jgi:hypothetical protein